MKSLNILLPLIAIPLPLTSAAERICPEGKSYRRDLCYEIEETSSGKRACPQGKVMPVTAVSRLMKQIAEHTLTQQEKAIAVTSPGI